MPRGAGEGEDGMSERVKVKLEFEWDGTSLPFADGDNINEFILGGIAAISPAAGEVMAGAKLLLTYPHATRYTKTLEKARNDGK